MLQATKSVQRLRTRVLDPELRQRIADFIALCSRNTLPPPGMPPEQIIAKWETQDREMGNCYVSLNELLGEHLRRELDRRSLAVEPAQDAAPPGQS